MRISRDTCIPIRVCIRRTAFLRSCARSTRHPLTQTSFGVKRRNRISKTPAVSHTQFTKSSRQVARVPLFAFVQLEEEARRAHDREVSKRIRVDGLQVSVHHAGWFPRAEPRDV